MRPKNIISRFMAGLIIFFVISLGSYPAEAIVPLEWLSPVVEFVKYAWTKLSTNNDDKNQLSNTLLAMDGDVKALQALPSFLYLARPLRLDAVELAQLASVAAQDESRAEQVWDTLKVKIEITRTDLRKIYDLPELRSLILANSALQERLEEGLKSLGEMEYTLSTSSSSSRLDAVRRVRDISQSVTKAGNYPEYWITEQSSKFVTRYHQLVSSLKPSQKVSASDSISNPLVLMASSSSQWPSEEQREFLDPRPAFLQKMLSDVDKPVGAPAWAWTTKGEPADIVVAVAKKISVDKWPNPYASLAPIVVLLAITGLSLLLDLYSLNRKKPSPSRLDVAAFTSMERELQKKLVRHFGVDGALSIASLKLNSIQMGEFINHLLELKEGVSSDVEKHRDVRTSGDSLSSQ